MQQSLRICTLALVVGLALGIMGALAFAQSEVVDVDGVPLFPPKLQEPSSQVDEAVPSLTCRTGFRQVGPRLCISDDVQLATQFANAMFNCQMRRARVATYGDLYYIYVLAPTLHDPTLPSSYGANGRWIGPNLISDDNALCGNNPNNDLNNFEGTCNKFDIRGYWCAHDLE